MATADSRLILSKLAELQAGMAVVQELKGSVAELQAGMATVQSGMGSLNQRLYTLETARSVVDEGGGEGSEQNCWSKVEPWHDYEVCCCDDD